MGWIITERKPMDNQTVDRLSNQYRIENGYLRYRGTLEEYTKDQRAATTVANLFDRYDDRRCEAVNVPNGGFLQVLVEGKPLHLLTGSVLAHAQALDITHDVHFRRTVFSLPGGGMVLVRARRFASLAQPHLICLEYTVQASHESEIVIHSGIDGDVWESNGPHLKNINTFVQEDLLTLTAQTHTQGIPIVVSEMSLLPGGKRVCVPESKRILQQALICLQRYQPVTCTKFVAVYTGEDSTDPLGEGKSLCSRAAKIGFDGLFQDHCALWEKRWRDIDGSGEEARPNSAAWGLLHSIDSC